MNKELDEQSISQLQTKVGKKYVERYKNLVHSHLVAITNKDEEVLCEIRDLLEDRNNYDFCTEEGDKKLASSIAKALELIQDSGNWPHERISSLSDLVDEGKTFLFPFYSLKNAPRQEIVELCEICRSIDEASLHYIESFLHQEFNDWTHEPLNSRISRNFKI